MSVIQFLYNASESPTGNAERFGKMVTEVLRDHPVVNVFFQGYHEVRARNFTIQRPRWSHGPSKIEGLTWLTLAMWCIQDDKLDRYVRLYLAPEVQSAINTTAQSFEHDGQEHTVSITPEGVYRHIPSVADTRTARIEKIRRQMRFEIAVAMIETMSIDPEVISRRLGVLSKVFSWEFVYKTPKTVETFDLTIVSQWMRSQDEYGAPTISERHRVEIDDIVKFRSVSKGIAAMRDPSVYLFVENLEFHNKTLTRMEEGLREVGYRIYRVLRPNDI